eukprot:jgi/Undpi1/936/HiC_scaffold_10.g04400.m1
MGSPGKRERGDDIARAKRRVVGMVDDAGGGWDEAASTVDGQRKGEWEAAKSASVEITSTVWREEWWGWWARVEGGRRMMQPVPLTAKENIAGEPRRGSASAW